MSPQVAGGGKILVGIAVLGVLYYKLPIVEILMLFFYIVLVPLMMLSAIGLIGSGTLDMFSNGTSQFFEDVKNRVEKMRVEMEQKAATPNPEPK